MSENILQELQWLFHCINFCERYCTLSSGTDRIILSGIKEYYKAEDLIGKTLVAICNLPERKMMGIPSQGMVISALHEYDGKETLNLLILDDSIPAGAKLY